MKDVPFDHAVRVMAEGRSGLSVPVNTAMDAAKHLLERDDWPKSAAASHLKARKACLEVLQGLRDAREAREAFQVAAKDAGFLRPSAAPLAAPTGETTVWRGRKYRLKRDR